MKKYCTFILLGCFLLISKAFADDSSFGGSGASPMPLKETKIAMLDEHITILGVGEDLEKWHFICDYTFKNTINAPITLTMGFPFPIYHSDEDNVSTPPGYSPKIGNPLVYNFAVSVDGIPVKATRQKIDTNLEMEMYYNDAYLWNIQFPPLQTVKTHHDYITGVGFDVMGYSWLSFVLRTGGLWKDGIIGRVIIEVIPNTPTRLCSTAGDFQYLKPTPAGIQILGTGRKRKYLWNLSNLRPKEDVSLCLQTGRNYVRSNIVDKALNSSSENDLNLNNLDQTKLRFLRNAIFAQYGKTFKDPQLQETFLNQWWYEINPNYTDAMLTKDDKEAIKRISDVEAKFKN